MDKKLLGLMLVFFLSFGLFTTIVVFNKPLSKLTRAKEEFLPSAEKSLIFAWPMTAKADGQELVKLNQELIKINVFVRNAKGFPLANKKVVLYSSLGKIIEYEAISDKTGKTTFALSSATPGIAEISATVDQIPLKQKVSVKFE